MFLWLLLIVPPVLLGLVVGRWRVLLIPPVFWVAWFLGLNQGWWGNGVGEEWQVAMVPWGIVGAALAVPGVALHKVGGEFHRVLTKRRDR